MSQIRITKTEEMQEVLDYFNSKYPLLDDSEIVKMTLSMVYNDMKQNDIYHLSPEEEKAVGESIKEGRCFQGNVDEAIEWLKQP